MWKFLLHLAFFCKADATYSLYKTVDHTNFVDFFYFDTIDYNHGNVEYVPLNEAKSLNMIRFDNNQIYVGAEMKSWGRRKSIKVQSKEVFNGGLFIIQLKHMPAGCGTWPAWWMFGPAWPNSGEIDIIEGVNVMSTDGLSLHTSAGCTAKGSYTGHLTSSDCNANVGNGCSIAGTDSKSFGTNFNANNGGAFAMLWDSNGIKAWFWEAGRLPADILSQKPNPGGWGLPYAAFDFGSNCPSNHFQNHQMVLNTNFCGDWAGTTFGMECPGKGSCTDYTNNPANVKEAYWLVDYIDIYSHSGPDPPPTRYCCLDNQNRCMDGWCNENQSQCETCNAHWGPAPEEAVGRSYFNVTEYDLSQMKRSQRLSNALAKDE